MTVSQHFIDQVNGFDEEKRVLLIAGIKGELKKFADFEKRRTELTEQEEYLSVLLGWKQPVKPRAAKGSGPSVNDVLAKIAEHAPHSGDKTLSAKDIGALFPDQNVKSALAKIKQEKSASISAQGKALRFKERAPVPVETVERPATKAKR